MAFILQILSCSLTLQLWKLKVSTTSSIKEINYEHSLILLLP